MTNYEKFLAKLTELFQLDQADLDFGIYRIMNAKRDEIVKFLDEDLLPQVREVLEQAQTEIGGIGSMELMQAEENARSLGVDPSASPKVQELRAKYGGTNTDLDSLEQDVFNHLYTFFNRYYDEGDFISQRRYKEGVYAIPYEGEEVKLHYANADQYYIKTAEHFRDYTFKVGEKRVHFKLVDAQTERDNNKEQEKRVFVFQGIEGEDFDMEGISESVADEDIDSQEVSNEVKPAIEEKEDGLILRFTYKNDSKKRSQKDLNELAHKAIIESAKPAWKRVLSTFSPTEKNPDRTILQKHLIGYTATNTFDYFIHQNLGGFLRRELDFYIKNEVMHLDDIEYETAPKVDQYMAKVRAIRKVAGKIITFLAQLEDFQKGLWLKKKFVIATQYLITLNQVPKEFYPDILTNSDQLADWIKLFFIDEIEGDLAITGYSNPLTARFLEENLGLVLSTHHFPEEFKLKLLSKIDIIDSSVDMILCHSDNFQALSLMSKRYRSKLSCIHIDPPYNTKTSGFIYKNNYQHSSWLAMMSERIGASLPYLKEDGHFQCHIDENEYESLFFLFNNLGIGNGGTIIWDKLNPMLGRKGIATRHEYILWRTNSNKSLYGLGQNIEKILAFAKEAISASGGVNEESRKKFSKWIANEPGLTGGDRAYKFIDDNGVVFQSASMSAGTPSDDQRYFLPVIHPVTGKPCPVPPTGWSRPPETLQNLRESGEILFGPDEKTLPRKKLTLTDVSRRQLSSVLQDTGRGKSDISDIGLEFPYSHPLSLYIELIGAAAKEKTAIVLDFFAGSGTAGQAVMELNQLDEGGRKVILVEAGAHFDSVLTPRISKSIYSSTWKAGKPVSRTNPTSQFVKIIRLECYEDTLSNIEFKEANQAKVNLLSDSAGLKEDYFLKYVLGSNELNGNSLLNIHEFCHPFKYKLKVSAGEVSESKEVNVDLVETFNWLLGLRVHTMDVIRGFHIVTGRLPGPGNSENGEKCLIIWRDMNENPNDKLDEFFKKQNYNTQDQEFDVIYVNCDNNLQNMRKDDQTWKVRLIEQDFHRLMWDTEDV